jgi:glucosamine-phosphate N-acetyltransferase
MKINLIIATYSGMYSKHSTNHEKQNYLKYTLNLINRIKTNIDQITIMKPKVNIEHVEVSDYYCFDMIDISNISHKIKIIECDNIGISYGQYFSAISKNIDFDYHIFIEDDYVPFKDYFEQDLINEIEMKNEGSLVCSFIYHNNEYEIINYSKNMQEKIENIHLLEEKLRQYNSHGITCNIPDFALGIFSKNTVQKIVETFGDFDNIKEFFNIPFTKIWIHQVLFGVFLKICNVPIHDFACSHMNIFYETSINDIFLCNFDGYVHSWKSRNYGNEKFKLPIFVPLDMIHINNYDSDLVEMKKYLSDENAFFERYNFLTSVQKACMNLASKNLVMREIEVTESDYNGYLELMYEFTNYKHDTNFESFSKSIQSMKDTCSKKILVLFSPLENKIVGAGTLFKLEKLHNNPIGQIEDVIIADSYRGLGLGKLMIQKLSSIGLSEFKCYKIILNCLDKNIEFYKKCNFSVAGVEMRLM